MYISPSFAGNNRSIMFILQGSSGHGRIQAWTPLIESLQVACTIDETAIKNVARAIKADEEHLHRKLSALTFEKAATIDGDPVGRFSGTLVHLGQLPDDSEAVVASRR